MKNLTLHKDVSMFVPEDNSDTTDSNASDETERQTEKSSVKQRAKLNEFLRGSNVDTIEPWRKIIIIFNIHLMLKNTMDLQIFCV